MEVLELRSALMTNYDVLLLLKEKTEEGKKYKVMHRNTTDYQLLYTVEFEVKHTHSMSLGLGLGLFYGGEIKGETIGRLHVDRVPHDIQIHTISQSFLYAFCIEIPSISLSLSLPMSL